jgi:hypothetical protein
VTKGINLGNWRNYFTVHIDDVFGEDSRWSSTANCTPGEGDCAAGTPATTPIRMKPTDVTNLVQWQKDNKFTLDMLYNGFGSDDAAAANGGIDILTEYFLAYKSSFRWMNHTWSHQFLGCQQDFTVIPWRCKTDATGNILYVDQATIDSEISKNLTFAQQKKLPINVNELVAGEHSGTFILPQQPADNPNYLASLTKYNIKSLGLDASREPGQRQVASALGIPRHPINVFFNVGRAAEEVDEYNWIYTSRANGGSGICEDNPATTTCIAPLSTSTGWQQYILPLQVKISLGYVTANDPRPFYMHQSNLTEDRLALQAVAGVLTAYRAAYANSTPVVSQTQTAAGQVLKKQDTWAQAKSGVTGYVQGNKVTIIGPSGTSVPVTVPNGTAVNGGGAFGEAYAGERSGYLTLGAASTVLTLSAPATTLTTTAPPTTTPPTGTTTPGTTTPVPTTTTTVPTTTTSRCLLFICF